MHRENKSMHENDTYQSQDTEYRLLSGKEGKNAEERMEKL